MKPHLVVFQKSNKGQTMHYVITYMGVRKGQFLSDINQKKEGRKNVITYSRVHISSDTAFLKIVKKPSIVQE